jgi:NADPH-dependent glutamate synthase beta subunit-like oxidoreductase
MSIERIDPNLCNGCGMCVNTCPCDVIRLDTLATINDKEEYAACRFTCPGDVNTRRYAHLLQFGMIDEAVDVLRDVLPLAAITGRVCSHPCESDCARKEVDEAVNINSLERFLGDYWLKEKVQPPRSIYSARIAIAGSGPAGLSAAYFLVRMGYPVTVFEAMPVLGGMLRVGIPEHLLPRDVLDAQINYLVNMGIEFKTDTAIGKDITLEELKTQGYQAVFLAIGNQLSHKIDIEGVKLNGVLWGLDFLKDVNLKRETKLGDRVLVIGGGDVAMEVASTAIHLGAKQVKLACLESEEEMPAHEETIKRARDEGVDINASWGIKGIVGDNGKVTGAELVRCLSVYDYRVFKPSFNEQETKVLEADTLILAIGQSADFSLMPKELETKGNIIQVDTTTLETNLPGVFAGGDVAISDTKSVIDAIASAKRAAVSIDRYLRGENLRAGRDETRTRVGFPPQAGIEKRARQIAPELPPEQRKDNFKEIKAGLSEDEAIREAQRCMTCGSRAVITYVDDCMLCELCLYECPRNAIYVSPEKHGPLLTAWG